MNHAAAYAGGVYLVVCCLLGGLVAWRKGDFFSRGLCISLMGGIFAPIFFAFSPQSHARQGDQTDLDLWHVNGVFPTITHVLVILVAWLIWTALK